MKLFEKVRKFLNRRASPNSSSLKGNGSRFVDDCPEHTDSQIAPETCKTENGRREPASTLDPAPDSKTGNFRRAGKSPASGPVEPTANDTWLAEGSDTLGASLSKPFSMPAFPPPKTHTAADGDCDPTELAAALMGVPASQQLAPVSRPDAPALERQPNPDARISPYLDSSGKIDFARIPAHWWTYARQIGSSSFNMNSLDEALRATGSNGTYEDRHAEQRRLGIQGRVMGNFESAHAVAVSVAAKGQEYNKAAGPLPASYVPMTLHQVHPDSGWRFLDEMPNGLKTSGADDRHHPGSKTPAQEISERQIYGGYRHSEDQREQARQMLRDATPGNETAAASMLYQTNSLGYSHILAAQARGQISPSDVLIPDFYGNPEIPEYFLTDGTAKIMTDSHRNMVENDPPIAYRLPTKEQGTVQLGPWGKAEATLAHYSMITGDNPDETRIASTLKQFLPSPQEKSEMARLLLDENTKFPEPPPPYSGALTSHNASRVNASAPGTGYYDARTEDRNRDSRRR